MGAYTIGLAVLTLLVTLQSSTSNVIYKTLTEGNTFIFRCDIEAKDALALFRFPMEYHYYNPRKGETVLLTQNSQPSSTGGGWNTAIHPESNTTHYRFELAGSVSLADSGTYYCTRGDANSNDFFNKTTVLTVTELTADVEDIIFSIAAMEDKVPKGEEFVVKRIFNETDPAPKSINLDSGFYQALCIAKEGTPSPTYTLRSGDRVLEYGPMKTVLLNSGTADLSCDVVNGKFTHTLKFHLTINPGHPSMLCSSDKTMVGATDAEIDCVVSGEDLDCRHFSWLSEMDMTSFQQKANYTVECEVNENRMQMKNILKFPSIKESDFDDGYILKFGNDLGETFQTVHKLLEKEEAISAGNNVVPMGTITLVFLSLLGSLL